ncbi:MAG: uroporphyrinogen-III synthase [Longimicrobiales bacterium]|nr:uroporphyrinogen-III synthase [Longimicrobiales bacterium]
MAELSGWTVVVTRAEGPRGPLAEALQAAGADVLYLPTIEIGPPEDAVQLDRALASLADFDWLVFTSPRAVDALVQRGAVPGEGLRIAAVGPSTRDRARAGGFPVDVTGDGGAAELAEALVSHGVGPGTRVFFPGSSRGRPDLARVLEEAGADVHEVVAYRTRIRPFDPSVTPELREVDVVTFTSPSAVQGWHASVGADPARFDASGVRFVAIGETTAAAVASHGMPVVIAGKTSLEGMVETICAFATSRTPESEVKER